MCDAAIGVFFPFAFSFLGFMSSKTYWMRWGWHIFIVPFFNWFIFIPRKSWMSPSFVRFRPVPLICSMVRRSCLWLGPISMELLVYRTYIMPSLLKLHSSISLGTNHVFINIVTKYLFHTPPACFYPYTFAFSLRSYLQLSLSSNSNPLGISINN